ncbi:MAG: NUDIX hydrolase [Ruminococcaceae bacterium]|nr:NUDIX hydrolase [Oscillospiraceae bacterium]
MLLMGDRTKGEIEIIKQNIIFSNDFMEISNDDVVFPSGNSGTYIRVNSTSNKSVAVLPVTKEGNIVVIRNYRHGMRGWGIEVPKGSVDPGESSEIAAIRELKEETGYVCEKLMHIGEYSESPAVFSSKIECFVALGCRLKGSPEPESTEAIDKVFEIPLEALLERDYKADFIDSLSELLACRYYIKKGDYVL